LDRAQLSGPWAIIFMVSDEVKSRKFYGKMLGIPETRRTETIWNS